MTEIEQAELNVLLDALETNLLSSEWINRYGFDAAWEKVNVECSQAREKVTFFCQKLKENTEKQTRQEMKKLRIEAKRQFYMKHGFEEPDLSPEDFAALEAVEAERHSRNL